MVWVRVRLCRLQERCTRLAAASDKAHQLLAHGRWFSPGCPASSTTKTGRHNIAEILLKVALSTKNQSINNSNTTYFTIYIWTEMCFQYPTTTFFHNCAINHQTPTFCRLRPVNFQSHILSEIYRQ